MKNKLITFIPSNLSITNKVALSLIFLWVAIALTGLVYNGVKSVSEVKEWFFLTDFEKRQKIFGELFTFLYALKSTTSDNATILVYSTDIRTFHLSLYYLYPRKITLVDSKNALQVAASTANYDYIALYHFNGKIDEIDMRASYSAIVENTSSIYKKR